MKLNRTTLFTWLVPAAVAVLGLSAPPVHAENFEYAIELATGRDGAQRVDADHIFRSGDRFRVVFDSDFDAFVYLFARGSGESEYTRLFPHGGFEASNLVRPNFDVYVPDGGGWLALDERAGVERLVLVVSDRPQRDLEESGEAVKLDRLDYTLSQLHRTRSRNGTVRSTKLQRQRSTRLNFKGFTKGSLVHVARMALTHHGR